jgi:hypothetical protein
MGAVTIDHQKLKLLRHMSPMIQGRLVLFLVLFLAAALANARPTTIGSSLDSLVQPRPLDVLEAKPDEEADSRSVEVMAAAQYVAAAMNSETFLRELCERKSTSNVTFYSRSKKSSPDQNTNRMASRTASPPLQCHVDHQNQSMKSMPLNGVFFGSLTGRSRGLPNPFTMRSDRNSWSLFDISFACEYVGKLPWLGRLVNKDKGIRFRETMDISQCRPYTVLCTTEYYNGAKWVKCAVVTCHILPSSLRKCNRNDAGGASTCRRPNPAMGSDSTAALIHLDTSSEILIPIPLIPKTVKTALNDKITSTFDAAAKAFIRNLYTAAVSL